MNTRTPQVVNTWCEVGMRVVYAGPDPALYRTLIHGEVLSIEGEFWADVKWHNMRGDYTERTLIYHMEPAERER